jgi:DNA-binding transcriptional regulator YiaG
MKNETKNKNIEIMTPSDFRAIRENLKMSQTDVALLFGYKNYQIVHLWEKGTAKIPSLQARIMLAISSMSEGNREDFVQNLSGLS